MFQASTILMVTLSLALATVASAQDTEKKKKEYKLPKDKKAVVISLDFVGGFTPPRLKNTPTMSILADGTIQIPANYQGQKQFQGKLTGEELQDLLRYIIEEQQFLKLDAKALKEKLTKNGPRIAVADAATTVIKVTVDGKTKEFAWYPVGFGQQKELAQFNAVRGRLMQVRSIVELGGKEEAVKWLKVANRELKAKHPKVKPLKLEHLQSGGKRANDSVYVSITRIEGDDPKPQNKTITSVFINQLAGKEPRITVTYREPQ